jgi:hypothetical protein
MSFNELHRGMLHEVEYLVGEYLKLKPYALNSVEHQLGSERGAYLGFTETHKEWIIDVIVSVSEFHRERLVKMTIHKFLNSGISWLPSFTFGSIVCRPMRPSCYPE